MPPPPLSGCPGQAQHFTIILLHYSPLPAFIPAIAQAAAHSIHAINRPVHAGSIIFCHNAWLRAVGSPQSTRHSGRIARRAPPNRRPSTSGSPHQAYQLLPPGPGIVIGVYNPHRFAAPRHCQLRRPLHYRQPHYIINRYRIHASRYYYYSPDRLNHSAPMRCRLQHSQLLAQQVIARHIRPQRHQSAPTPTGHRAWHRAGPPGNRALVSGHGTYAQFAPPATIQSGRLCAGIRSSITPFIAQARAFALGHSGGRRRPGTGPPRRASGALRHYALAGGGGAPGASGIAGTGTGRTPSGGTGLPGHPSLPGLGAGRAIAGPFRTAPPGGHAIISHNLLFRPSLLINNYAGSLLRSHTCRPRRHSVQHHNRRYDITAAQGSR